MTRDEVSNKLVEYFQKNGYSKARNNGSGVTACKGNSCDLNVLLEARGRKHVIVHVYPHYDEYEVDLGWSWEKAWDTGDYERLKEVVDNARMWIESGSRVGFKAVTRETKKVGATQTRQFEEPKDCCEKIAKLWDPAELVQFIEGQEDTELLRARAAREGLSLIVRPSYSNKSGIVDFRVVKKSSDCARGAGKSPYAFGIGVQLQGEQYRRCAHIDRAQYHVSDDELYSRFSDENGWFDNRAFMGRGTSMHKKFCKYVTKGEVFVYQYVDLKDYSFSEIYKKMVADLTMVIEMMERGVLIEAFVAE